MQKQSKKLHNYFREHFRFNVNKIKIFCYFISIWGRSLRERIVFEYISLMPLIRQCFMLEGEHVLKKRKLISSAGLVQCPYGAKLPIIRQQII